MVRAEHVDSGAAFRDVLRRWRHHLTGREAEIVERIRKWDARLTADSTEAMIFELWVAKLPRHVFGPRLGPMIPLASSRRVQAGCPAWIHLGPPRQ